MKLQENMRRTSLLAALGSACLLVACATVLPMVGYPPEATRKSAPAGIDARAVGLGDGAPAFELSSHAGETVALAEARKAGPVVLVFYRGHW